ncbi:hypothetical protein Ancab_037752 [Ancistrocladus abbreviatus]
MAAGGLGSSNIGSTNSQQTTEKRHRSIFDLPVDYFDSCCLIPHRAKYHPPDASSISTTTTAAPESLPASSSKNAEETLNINPKIHPNSSNALPRWSCNTCKSEFESLQDQRSHFKSDIHRFNVKLSLAGKAIVKEEDWDDLTFESLHQDFDVSSISGSEDEDDKECCTRSSIIEGSDQSAKHKLFISLYSGERVSIWKSLILNDSENISYDGDQVDVENDGHISCLKKTDVTEKLKALLREPRNNTNLRVVLLASGGHFAGCVFDGNTIVAHKTFHRYVVRAKAGKKQSSKDASGKAAHSAGASLRRYNELALKKEIQELLASWKPYFDASSCAFIYAPSSNRHYLFNGEKLLFSDRHLDVRSIPLTVRRPTFKEAWRVYSMLSQVSFEVDEKEFPNEGDLPSTANPSTETNVSPGLEDSLAELRIHETAEACSSINKSDEQFLSGDSEIDVMCMSGPLHDAAKSGDAQRVWELLEQGLDPSSKDERGKTPYMLAVDKEVRNTFRRFMALNLDKWDWLAAKVPSALTKEMEESQAAKQAEKDAKRKAKSKELKKLRKAREKKAQAEATNSQNVATVVGHQDVHPPPVVRRQPESTSRRPMSKEEELKRKQAEEREKRAAAAERRMAAAAASATPEMAYGSTSPITSQPRSSTDADIICSCCNASLTGKIPFHRYNYKYCSTTCMRVHREILEDG